MKNKIIHIMTDTQGITPLFIDFVEAHFDSSSHQFFIDTKKTISDPRKNVVYGKIGPHHPIKMIILLWAMFSAKKIIFHGLFCYSLLPILVSLPFLLKKSYWVIWGGDLYFYTHRNDNWKRKLAEYFRRPIIKKIGYLVTFLPGDYALAKKWYGAQGTYKESLVYPNPTLLPTETPIKVAPKLPTDPIRILAGNSADPENNHLELFQKLIPYKDDLIEIYTPLAYGNPQYAKKVITEGQKLFGDKFYPMTDFMDPQKYANFLNTIDIAVFAHNRQQAMGNTLSLIALGKKVYLKNNLSSWDLLHSLKIKVFNTNLSIDLTPLSPSDAEKNTQNIRAFFSKETLYTHLTHLFHA